MKRIEKTICAYVADEVADRVSNYLDEKVNEIEHFIDTEDFSDEEYSYLDPEEPDYSDIETLYGKPSVSFDEVYRFMMNTENKLADEEDGGDVLETADLKSRLWQVCHQLIHDALVILANGDTELDYTFIFTPNETNEGLSYIDDTDKVSQFHASFTEGVNWFTTESGKEINDEDVDLGHLFCLAQLIYWETKK